MKGLYHVGIDHIRSLAITCHALDGQFDRLFNSETICGQSKEIEHSYNQLLHTSLLNLAISIRVAFSKRPEYRLTGTGVTDCGLFEVGAPREEGGFSTKDVCDKIIHANSIFKPVEPGVKGAGCSLRGTYKRKPWQFEFAIAIFCEYVLKWLGEIENRSQGPME